LHLQGLLTILEGFLVDSLVKVRFFLSNRFKTVLLLCFEHVNVGFSLVKIKIIIMRFGKTIHNSHPLMTGGTSSLKENLRRNCVP
jgi:hypothetical protein